MVGIVVEVSLTVVIDVVVVVEIIVNDHNRTRIAHWLHHSG